MFSKSHLCKIHAYIFQDIYSFAGKFRTEDTSKGTTQFWRCEYIDVALTNLLKELKNEKYLRGKNKDEFANRVAYYFAKLNMIHPFREGNGRALRMFIRQLGLYCGFEIDWSKLTSSEILKAMVDGVDKNYENLQRCIIKSID